MPTEPAAGEIAHDDMLRDRLTANLARHDVRQHPGEGRKHAAVAVIVLDSDAERHGADPVMGGINAEQRRAMLADIPGAENDPTLTGDVEGTAGGAAVLLTRRGSHLRGHGGQWALPGGRVDDGETALEAAMREAAEEVSLELTSDDLLGRLDDYPTRSGYVISPFVFWLSDDRDPVANPAEVASLHRVSMRELTRDDSPRFVSIPESDRPVVQIPIGGDLIHAPTGAVLYQFRAVAYDGLNTRVDELEQPVFAWR
ncbi:NUDIX hydrolase [Candidatus Poriferisodalis sp.]|uniref:NUDIX hydrolase n=1 Tax=Candidatus Poriferisodalis sp. TaxID=3101277 RepID=UPI003B58D238